MNDPISLRETDWIQLVFAATSAFPFKLRQPEKLMIDVSFSSPTLNFTIVPKEKKSILQMMFTHSKPLRILNKDVMGMFHEIRQ